MIRVLFDKGRRTLTEHLKNIFDTGELAKKTGCRDFDRLPRTARITRRSSKISTPSSPSAFT
jgi:hypothetical protein